MPRADGSSHPWAVLQVVGGAAVLVFLIVKFGGGPIGAAWSGLTVESIVAALLISAFYTLCIAARWQLIAAALGLPVSFRRAVAAYYASQFLNATLPGGVLGDVDRAVRFGRHTRTSDPLAASTGRGGSFARAVRSVVWDRSIGQGVQIGVMLLVAAVVPSALRRAGMTTVLALAVVCAGLLLIASRRQAGAPSAARPSRWRRMTRAIAADWALLRRSPRRAGVIVLLSLGAFAGYLALFVASADAVEVTASTGTLVWAGMIVLAFAAIPISVAGFGAREGAAAWVFTTVGLAGGQGLAVSIEYGLLALIGALPGILVLAARLVVPRFRR